MIIKGKHYIDRGGNTMFQVVKRDGEIAEFKMNKITRAIGKAFAANEKHFSDDMLELLGLRVTSDFQKKIRDNQITVEDIQDSVETVSYTHLDVYKRQDEANNTGGAYYAYHTDHEGV